jgi:hypothetical protein
MRTSMVAAMGTNYTHRGEEVRSAREASRTEPRREPPLATRVSVRRVMRAFKRV